MEKSRIFFPMKSRIQYCWECGARAKTAFVEGRDRKVCSACGQVLYENPFPTTAAIIVNDRDEILLVRRAVPPARGEWCLPGGFLELGETPEEGVLRELKEETNLEGIVQGLIGLCPSLHGYWGDVLVAGYHVKINGGTMQPGDDARDVRYFPLQNRPRLAFDTHQQLLVAYIQSSASE